MLGIRRRGFMALLGGAAAWPLAARAQQRAQMRRVGALMNLPAGDQEGQLYTAAFEKGLQELGWTVGRNLRIDYRWDLGSSSQERLRQQVAEVVAFAPDVMLVQGGNLASFVGSTVPIVLPQSIDPVGAGLVTSLAKPGGNITGFTQFEYSLCGKWLQLLKEIAPRMTRVGVLRTTERGPAGTGQWAVIQSTADLMGLDCAPITIGNDEKATEHSIAAFASSGKGGLIVTLNPFASIHRRAIIADSARFRLPAIYPFRYFAADGGLMSYGADLTIQYRRAAGYVDRILRGELPADLPVQKPTKYELTINLKTAKALSLTVPPTLLAIADEIIE